MAGLAFAAYLAAAVWAREISLEGPALIWFPPAAVAIAACYFQARLVWVIVLAELVSTTLVMHLGSEYGPALLVVNSVGLAFAYAVGAWVLRRLALDPRLRNPEDLAVVALGIGAGSAAATVIGVAVQWAADLIPTDDLARSAALFWVGDIVGAACVLPALLIVGNDLAEHRRLRLADDEDILPRWQLDAELLAPAIAGLALMEIGEAPMRFVYLAFLPVVIVAVRHGVAAAALSSAALAAVMTAGAHVQLADVLDRSDFQLLLLVLVVTGITTGSVVSSRRDINAAKARVSEIIEATPDLVASASRDGTIRYLNPVGRQLLGVSPDASPGSRAFDFFPDSLAQDLVREGMRTAERAGTWTGENRLRRPDGHQIPISQVLVAHPEPDDDGQRIYSTICRDMTSQHALEDQLRRAALYDESTGLPNRVLLVEQLARTIQGLDADRRVAVLFADLDHLQRINETFGFAAGDQVVTTIARRLGEVVRAQDLVARHGGSQFVVVLADVPDEFEAILLADRLLACFAEPVDAEGHELQVSGSIGITLAAAGQDHLESLRSAEIALHRAKEAGGGRYALFDEDLQRRSLRRLEREADLHDVLTKQTWSLAYQPIFDARERQVVGVEALLRWTHPTRGPVPPFELIRLAEHSGAIVALGREIFRRACHEATQWHAMGFAVPVSINVSARQLREPSFLADVESVLQETGIEPGCVVAELTETVLTTREHGEIETLEKLRNLGCRIALDDFGTGYSSLSELRDLPIDVVKIDQSFMTDLTTSPRAAALVGAVVQLSEALDLTVVAEGVEHDDQIEALAALGCHRIQGYALSRPV
ncbi:MAG: EAL domain-containing protein [Aquihabitans sp.]